MLLVALALARAAVEDLEAVLPCWQGGQQLGPEKAARTNAGEPLSKIFWFSGTDCYSAAVASKCSGGQPWKGGTGQRQRWDLVVTLVNLNDIADCRPGTLESSTHVPGALSVPGICNRRRRT